MKDLNSLSQPDIIAPGKPFIELSAQETLPSDARRFSLGDVHESPFVRGYPFPA